MIIYFKNTTMHVKEYYCYNHEQQFFGCQSKTKISSLVPLELRAFKQKNADGTAVEKSLRLQMCVCGLKMFKNTKNNEVKPLKPKATRFCEFSIRKYHPGKPVRLNSLLIQLKKFLSNTKTIWYKSSNRRNWMGLQYHCKMA